MERTTTLLRLYDLPVNTDGAAARQVANSEVIAANVTPPPVLDEGPSKQSNLSHADQGALQRTKELDSPSLIRVESSVLQTISTCALLGSGALYGIGLIIANFNAQQYGRYSLGLVEAQYVLVGLLWLALTLLSFAISRSGMRWMRGHGPWEGRDLRENLKSGVLVLLAWTGLLFLFAQILAFLGVANVYSSSGAAIIVIMFGTNSALGALFQETWNEMKARSKPQDSALRKVWNADSIEVSKRVFYFFTALSFYAAWVYPQLSTAVGGGKLNKAELLIRQDRRTLLDGIEGLTVDKSGKLGPVGVVAETEQSFIVTRIDKPWWNTGRKSLLIKKDIVELVIYDR